MPNRVLYDGYVSDFNQPFLCGDDEQLIIDHPKIFISYYFYDSIVPRGRTKFLVNLWRELRQCGNKIAREIVSSHGGALSLLARGFEDWLRISGKNSEEFDLTDLARYLDSKDDAFSSTARLIHLVEYVRLTEHDSIADSREIELR